MVGSGANNSRASVESRSLEIDGRELFEARSGLASTDKAAWGLGWPIRHRLWPVGTGETPSPNGSGVVLFQARWQAVAALDQSSEPLVETIPHQQQFRSTGQVGNSDSSYTYLGTETLTLQQLFGIASRLKKRKRATCRSHWPQSVTKSRSEETNFFSLWTMLTAASGEGATIPAFSNGIAKVSPTSQPFPAFETCPDTQELLQSTFAGMEHQTTTNARTCSRNTIAVYK